MTTQPESKVSTAIMKAWRARGAWCMKVHGSAFQTAGVPDIAGVANGHAVYCETKMPGNKPSLRQWNQIGSLRQAGALVCVAYSVADAVAMLDHLFAGEHKWGCGCPYSEPVDMRAIYEKRYPKDV